MANYKFICIYITSHIFINNNKNSDQKKNNREIKKMFWMNYLVHNFLNMKMLMWKCSKQYIKCRKDFDFHQWQFCSLYLKQFFIDFFRVPSSICSGRNNFYNNASNHNIYFILKKTSEQGMRRFEWKQYNALTGMR